MNDKGNYCIKSVPRLSEVVKMRMTDVLKTLTRCPFSEYFCEQTDVVKQKIKKLEDGRAMVTKMVLKWTEEIQLNMIEEAGSEKSDNSSDGQLDNLSARAQNDEGDEPEFCFDSDDEDVGGPAAQHHKACQADVESLK